VPQWVYVVGGGVVGCTFALLGIINHFIPFLVTLGLVIPPIAAIYVIDGFIAFRSKTQLPETSIRWPAIAVWAFSLAVTLPAASFGLTLTTVPALDATILAAVTYFAVLKFIRVPQKQ